MPQRTDCLSPHQLLEIILACHSRDAIHEMASGWLRANPPGESPNRMIADAVSRNGLATLLHSMGREAELTEAEADSIGSRNRVFLVAARPRTAPSSLDPIAIYSSREAAEAWVSIQDPVLQEVLEIHPWRLDEHTVDKFWTKPACE